MSRILTGRMMTPMYASDSMLPTTPPTGDAKNPTVSREDFKGIWQIFDGMVATPTDRGLPRAGIGLLTYDHIHTFVNDNDDVRVSTFRFHGQVEGEPSTYLDMYFSIGAHEVHGEGSILMVATRALGSDGNAPASPEAIANWQIVSGVGVHKAKPRVGINPNKDVHDAAFASLIDGLTD